MPLYHSSCSTPLGELLLIAAADGLCSVLWPQDARARMMFAKMNAQASSEHEILLQAATELSQYFQGTRRHFNVPQLIAGSHFQQQVWQQLERIPFAHSTNYAHIASAVHRPQAARAVGQAVACNPLAIIIPCHRVLGRTGRLTGFAGGLANKQWLLDWEQSVAQRPEHIFC